MGTLLEVKELKTYFHTLEGVVKAVDGISYEVDEGETLTLVGESGYVRGNLSSHWGIGHLSP